jgi:outer membrane usher protein FimD/PapC
MKTYQWRACPVALGLIAALWPQTGLSESYFNPAFLSDDSAGVADLSRFEKGHQQAPGVYRVDIWRNDEFIGTQDVRFEKATGTRRRWRAGFRLVLLAPCLTVLVSTLPPFRNWRTCRAMPARH